MSRIPVALQKRVRLGFALCALLGLVSRSSVGGVGVTLLLRSLLFAGGLAGGAAPTPGRGCRFYAEHRSKKARFRHVEPDADGGRQWPLRLRPKWKTG